MTQWDTIDTTELEEATSVLIVASEVSQPVELLFADLMLSLESAPEHVLGVLLSKSPWDVLEPWRTTFPDETTSFSFVSADGVSRSVATGASSERSGNGTEVTRVEDVMPLAELGQKIIDRLAEREDAETVICFHSLTDLLEYVGTETAFRFLHVVLSRARKDATRAIVHVDGDVHGERTVAQLGALFDLVVEFDAGGSAGGRP